MNKHDALIETIERTIRRVPEYEDRQPGLDALISLADEYEKLREMGKEVQDRLTWTIKACTVDRDAKFELESLLSTVEDALKAQQSGEEGE